MFLNQITFSLKVYIHHNHILRYKNNNNIEALSNQMVQKTPKTILESMYYSCRELYPIQTYDERRSLQVVVIQFNFLAVGVYIQ